MSLSQVSIPHRYDTDAEIHGAIICEIQVSIPHRYDTDAGPFLSQSILLRWFQFLIGTILTGAAASTHSASARVSIPHRYDTDRAGANRELFPLYVSIPHRYDTDDRVLRKYERIIERFQFLIGTILTRRPDHLITPFPRVSIPHRYDTDELLCQPFSDGPLTFQFLIGTILTYTGDWYIVIDNEEFQFLIGTILTFQ